MLATESSCPKILERTKIRLWIGNRIALLLEGVGLKKDIPELRTYDREILNPK